MVKGPQQERLDRSLTAVETEIRAGETQWRVAGDALEEVGRVLGLHAYMAKSSIGGDTGESVEQAFTQAARAMGRRAEVTRRGKNALDRAAKAVSATQVGLAVMNLLTPQPDHPGAKPPPPTPGVPPTREEMEEQSKHNDKQRAYDNAFADREERARALADHLDDEFLTAAEVMKSIHGEPDPRPDVPPPPPGGGPGTGTPPPGGTVPPPGGHPPPPPVTHPPPPPDTGPPPPPPGRPPEHPPDFPPDFPPDRPPELPPDVPPPDVTPPGRPDLPDGPTHPTPGEIGPGTIGGLAAGGLGLAGLGKALRGGLVTPGHPVRPGGIARSAVAGTGSPVTRGAGARGVGAGAGQRGAGGGRGAGTAGRRGGAGAGAGGRRGKGKEKERRSKKDSWDVEDDSWVDDEGVGDEVLR